MRRIRCTRGTPRATVRAGGPAIVVRPTRAPEGKQTAWGYCHVPSGSDVDMTEAIEAQIERFAPGFRDLILERHTMNAAQFEAHNPNYIGATSPVAASG